jgi:hypothetical protein
MGGALVRRSGPWTLAELVGHLAAARPVYEAARRFPTALVREAIASGRVSEWEDSPIGRAILLSGLECERRGLELADVALERSQWVSIRSRRTTPSGPPIEDAPEVDVGGDEPEPIDALIAREEQEAREQGPLADRPGRRIGDREPPRPIVILGSTLPCWSRSVERLGADPCRVCGGRLRPSEYCLACCRSGIDHRLPSVPPPAKKKRLAGARS